MKRFLFAQKKFQKRTKLDVLFFGSDEYSLESLKILHKSTYLVNKLEIVCPMDKRKGYKLKLLPVPIKEYAIQENILFYHPDSDVTLKNWKVPYGKFDIGVCVSFR